MSAFGVHEVRYLLVGAHALAAHGHVRATKDLALWVEPSEENAGRVLRALAAFGAPLQDLTVADLSRPGVIFQMDLPPVRIDVLTAIDGVAFDEAWPDRFQAHFGDLAVPVLSRRHLIANKRATGRLQDSADVERLEALGDPPPRA